MKDQLRFLRRFIFGAALATAMVGCGDSGIPVTAADPIEGQRDALVTVVVFGDYQCPYTARAFRTLEDLRNRYSTEELRLAWKHFPLSFHPAARPTAESAAVVNVLAGAEPFWRLSQRMLESQRQIAPETLDEWVSELGVPLHEYRALLAEGVGATKVDTDLALASSLGVRASPTIFVNGVEIEGAQPARMVAATIDRTMIQARKQIAVGVDRAAVYDVVTMLNRSSMREPRAVEE